MKKLLASPIIIIIFLFNSCKNSCYQTYCTTEFVSIDVKFVDSNGDPLVVKNFKSVVLRTQKDITDLMYIDTVLSKGVYSVASDGNKNDVHSSDKVIVTAKNPKSNEVKEAEFLIGKDDCSCHIQKISGPEEISFQF